MNITYGFRATMTAKPGRADELVDLLLSGPTTGPAANEHCQLFLVSRSASDPDVVIVQEGWTSAELHDEVFNSPAAQAYVARFADLVDGESGYTDDLVVGGRAQIN